MDFKDGSFPSILLFTEKSMKQSQIPLSFDHKHISHRFRWVDPYPISSQLKPENKKRYACNLNVQTCFLKEASILQNPHSKNSVTISRLLSYFNRFFPNFEIGLISLTTLREIDRPSSYMHKNEQQYVGRYVVATWLAVAATDGRQEAFDTSLLGTD